VKEGFTPSGGEGFIGVFTKGEPSGWEICEVADRGGKRTNWRDEESGHFCYLEEGMVKKWHKGGCNKMNVTSIKKRPIHGSSCAFYSEDYERISLGGGQTVSHFYSRPGELGGDKRISETKRGAYLRGGSGLQRGGKIRALTRFDRLLTLTGKGGDLPGKESLKGTISKRRSWGKAEVGRARFLGVLGSRHLTGHYLSRRGKKGLWKK